MTILRKIAYQADLPADCAGFNKLYMKVLEIKVLKGPNYWSVRRPKLIQMKLDLEEMEQRPTNSIAGFSERLEKMFPTMIEHRCSEGNAGWFF
jgi:cyanophycin synthetase